jgi:hypothetical protein
MLVETQQISPRTSTFSNKNFQNSEISCKKIHKRQQGQVQRNIFSGVDATRLSFLLLCDQEISEARFSQRKIADSRLSDNIHVETRDYPTNQLT